MARYTNISTQCANLIENYNKNLVKDNWINTNLNTPRCIAFDENFLYITNSEGDNIVKSPGVYTHFKPSTSEIVVWAAKTGSGSIPTLNKPWGIVIDGQDMYVVNSGNNTITKIENFRASSRTSYLWAAQSGARINNVPLNGPREVVIKDNDMYITNFNGNSITKIENFRAEAVTLSTTIDSVKGWQGNHENPGGKVTSSEDCRQQALNSDGRYVAWGYRNSNHPDPYWTNTCFLYTQGFAPFNGDPNDSVHETGCLRPGERVSLGCTIPPGARGYTMNLTNSNLLKGPYSIVFIGNDMYVSCVTSKSIVKITNNNCEEFISELTDPYGLAFKNDNFYFASGVMVVKFNIYTKILSLYIGTLSGSLIRSVLNSPIGVYIFNRDIYITNPGNNSITKILNFETL